MMAPTIRAIALIGWSACSRPPPGSGRAGGATVCPAVANVGGPDPLTAIGACCASGSGNDKPVRLAQEPHGPIGFDGLSGARRRARPRAVVVARSGVLQVDRGDASLLAALELEVDALTFVERAHARPLDRRDVHE